MSEELTLLKERADMLGVKYGPNIGVEALKVRINEVLANDGKPEDSAGNPVDGASLAPAAGPTKTPAQLIQEERKRQHKEQLRLVRIRVTCLNPHKANSRGEIISVGNSFLGTVRKFVPFGEATDNGYHVPYIIFTELKSRKFNSVKTTKGQHGQMIVTQRLVNEFAIEELEPLSEVELRQLANAQAAAGGLAD